MKSAIIAQDRQRKETGETVVFVTAKEVTVILLSLEQYKLSHKRSKLVATLISEFEMIPCAKFPNTNQTT
jgi:hypothetical protein